MVNIDLYSMDTLPMEIIKHELFKYLDYNAIGRLYRTHKCFWLLSEKEYNDYKRIGSFSKLVRLTYGPEKDFYYSDKFRQGYNNFLSLDMEYVDDFNVNTNIDPNKRKQTIHLPSRYTSDHTYFISELKFINLSYDNIKSIELDESGTRIDLCYGELIPILVKIYKLTNEVPIVSLITQKYLPMGDYRLYMDLVNPDSLSNISISGKIYRSKTKEKLEIPILQLQYTGAECSSSYSLIKLDFYHPVFSIYFLGLKNITDIELTGFSWCNYNKPTKDYKNTISYKHKLNNEYDNLYCIKFTENDFINDKNINESFNMSQTEVIYIKYYNGSELYYGSSGDDIPYYICAISLQCISYSNNNMRLRFSP